MMSEHVVNVGKWFLYLVLGNHSKFIYASCMEKTVMEYSKRNYYLASYLRKHWPGMLALVVTLNYVEFILPRGLPWWLRQWRICQQYRRHEFDPWVGKIPWRREWQPTPGFLPGEFHGERSLAGYSPVGSERAGHGWATNTFTLLLP